MAAARNPEHRGIALLVASGAAAAVANLGFALGDPLEVGLPALAAAAWALSLAARQVHVAPFRREHAALR